MKGQCQCWDFWEVAAIGGLCDSCGGIILEANA